MKLVKTSGAVVCMNIDHNSRHLAVGSDQGNVRYFFGFSFFAFLIWRCVVHAVPQKQV